MNLDEKKEKYLKLVQPIFPELDIAGSFSMYSGDAPKSGKITLGNESTAFKNKFKNSGDFIHYTSLESVLNILNTKQLRLYNCQNLNDKLEVKYAVKEFGLQIPEDDLETFRQQLFVFSASTYDINLKNDDFNLWRLYGNSGLGAAIVFGIENFSDDWESLFFGKISYELDVNIYEDFKKFIKIHQDFNNEYALFENIPSIIPIIALHFKNKIWSIENEIRLIAHCPFDKYSLETIHYESGNSYLTNTIKHTLNRSGEKVAYVSLPLNLKEERDRISKIIREEEATNTFLKCIPHLKIKKIIIGHEVSAKSFVEVQSILHQVISKELGYNIAIEYSSFRDK
ncbi:MAG: DUF2971 domain-containing protein [Flavobacterium sp.]